MDYTNLVKAYNSKKANNVHFANKHISNNYFIAECYFNFPIETLKVIFIGNNKNDILECIADYCYNAYQVELLKAYWYEKRIN